MAARMDITVDAGATFERSLAYTNSDGSLVNLEGFVAEFQCRREDDLESDEPAAAQRFAVIDSATGEILLRLDPEDTAPLRGEYVYAIELRSPATTIRLIEGYLTATPEVVR
jgi:hypothetical protein